jgi:5'-3' exonuclease
MGIQGGSSQLLGYTPQKIYTRGNKDIRLKYVVIDSGLIFRYIIGSLNSGHFIVDKFGNKVSEVYHFLVLALKYLSDDIIPIFVFDGRSPKNKSTTVGKRREIRDKATKVVQEMKTSTLCETTTTETKTRSISEDSVSDETVSEETVSDETVSEVMCCEEKTKRSGQRISSDKDAEKLKEYIKHLKRSYSTNSKNIETAKRLLRCMGVPVIDAPFEADSQCAVIASEFTKNIVGIVTDDPDPIMYCPVRILKMPNLGSRYLEEYSTEATLEFLQKKLERIIDGQPDLKKMYAGCGVAFRHSNLVDIGCLMGSDYCPKMKIKKSDYSDGSDRSRIDILLEIYARNGMSLSGVLVGMGSLLSKNYISKMLNARETYRNPHTTDPRNLDISFKQPCSNMIRLICSTFISQTDVDQMIRLLDGVYNKCQNSKNPKKLGDQSQSICYTLPAPLYRQSILEECGKKG